MENVYSFSVVFLLLLLLRNFGSLCCFFFLRRVSDGCSGVVRCFFCFGWKFLVRSRMRERILDGMFEIWNF